MRACCPYQHCWSKVFASTDSGVWAFNVGTKKKKKIYPPNLIYFNHLLGPVELSVRKCPAQPWKERHIPVQTQPCQVATERHFEVAGVLKTSPRCSVPGVNAAPFPLISKLYGVALSLSPEPESLHLPGQRNIVQGICVEKLMCSSLCLKRQNRWAAGTGHATGC